jgi:peptidoglycan/LPS O-acetylase OafA/YrhL
MGIIRFILAISVVLTHSREFFGFNLLGGPLSVQAFFIISGFYMTLILNEKYIGRDSYGLFITNRFMRIFPLYLIVAVAALTFSWISFKYPGGVSPSSLFPNVFEMYSKHYDSINIPGFVFLIFTNIFIFFQDVVMFLGLNTSGDLFFTPDFRTTDPRLYSFLVIPQAWSVAVELTFYLIAPFIVRKRLPVISVIIILSFIARLITYNSGFSNDPWSYRFLPFEIGYFLMGTISYHIYAKIRTAEISKRNLWIIYVALLGLTIGYPVLKFTNSQYLYCILFAIALPFVFQLSKKWKYDAIIGELSYPIYITHVLALSIVWYYSESITGIFRGPVFLFITIGLSFLLNELIAKKIEKYRQNRIRTDSGKLQSEARKVQIPTTDAVK